MHVSSFRWSLFYLLLVGLQIPDAAGQGIMDWLLLGASGIKRAAQPATAGDLASQGLGLVNYFTNVQRSPGFLGDQLQSSPNLNNKFVNLPGIGRTGFSKTAASLSGLSDLPALPIITVQIRIYARISKV